MQAKSFRRPFTVGFSSAAVLELNCLTVFVTVRRKLVPHRDTGQTRNQAICFVTHRIRHVDWRSMRQFGTYAEPSYRHVNIVGSGSTTTFLLTSFAGQDQRLTSCFKLLLFLYQHEIENKKKKRNKQTLFESIDGVTSRAHSTQQTISKKPELQISATWGARASVPATCGH